YEVISTAKGPDGERVSILTTNQTHTAVENLNPESRYSWPPALLLATIPQQVILQRHAETDLSGPLLGPSFDREDW
ncbi:hypothetical protein XENOCAPTIV_001532, partial [Xenoophorus captivus]